MSSPRARVEAAALDLLRTDLAARESAVLRRELQVLEVARLLGRSRAALAAVTADAGEFAGPLAAPRSPLCAARSAAAFATTASLPTHAALGAVAFAAPLAAPSMPLLAASEYAVPSVATPLGAHAAARCAPSPPAPAEPNTAARERAAHLAATSAAALAAAAVGLPALGLIAALAAEPDAPCAGAQLGEVPAHAGASGAASPESADLPSDDGGWFIVRDASPLPTPQRSPISPIAALATTPRRAVGGVALPTPRAEGCMSPLLVVAHTPQTQPLKPRAWVCASPLDVDAPSHPPPPPLPRVAGCMSPLLVSLLAPVATLPSRADAALAGARRYRIGSARTKWQHDAGGD